MRRFPGLIVRISIKTNPSKTKIINPLSLRNSTLNNGSFSQVITLLLFHFFCFLCTKNINLYYSSYTATFRLIYAKSITCHRVIFVLLLGFKNHFMKTFLIVAIAIVSSSMLSSCSSYNVCPTYANSSLKQYNPIQTAHPQVKAKTKKETKTKVW